MTGSQRLDTILMFLGALVPLMSAAASFINHLVRQKTDAGEQVSPMMLNMGAAFNAASINVDKAVQLAQMAKGKSVATTITQPAQPTTQVTQIPDSHV
jgi:hypothetical protein